jgi:hypothetical protein
MANEHGDEPLEHTKQESQNSLFGPYTQKTSEMNDSYRLLWGLEYRMEKEAMEKRTLNNIPNLVGCRGRNFGFIFGGPHRWNWSQLFRRGDYWSIEYESLRHSTGEVQGGHGRLN